MQGLQSMHFSKKGPDIFQSFPEPDNSSLAPVMTSRLGVSHCIRRMCFRCIHLDFSNVLMDDSIMNSWILCYCLYWKLSRRRLCVTDTEQPSDFFRDHFVYASSQWETTLQCNVVSHWLCACTRNDPCFLHKICLLQIHHHWRNILNL